jgi:hypothetical protein
MEIEIITGVGTILTIIGGFILNFQKNKTERLKMKKESETENMKIIDKLSEVDLMQNAKIDTLVISLNNHIEKEEGNTQLLQELSSLLKHQPFFGKLSSLLTLRVYKLTKDVNSEVSDMLFRSLQAIKPYFEEILKSDFAAINEDIVFLEIKTRAKNVRSSINYEKLQLSEFESINLISNLNHLLKQPIKTFARDLTEISTKLTNGERRNEFERLCIDLIDKEIETTINAYNSIKKAT